MKALAVEPAAPLPPLSAAPRRVQRSCACGTKTPDGEACDACAVQRKQRWGGAGDRAGTPAIAELLATAGRPLAAPVRDDMESRFGADFSRVRIHDDAMAARAADSVDARAFTLGDHIAFSAGAYQPHDEAGRHLLAHELAHTIQQSRGGATVQGSGGPGELALEREADAAADAVLAWRPPPPLSAAPAAVARARGSRSAPATPAPVPAAPGTKVPVVVQGRTYEVEMLSFLRSAVVNDQIVEVKVDTFHLPGTKGVRAFEVYDRVKPSPLIRVPVTESARSSLKQYREITADLRNNWLQRVGWPRNQADALWKGAGGDDHFPKVGGTACHMDHIVELQLGGSGQPINIQALDPAPNMDSGRRIHTNLTELACAIADTETLGLRRASGSIQLKLRFEKIQHDGAPVETPCQRVESAALANRRADGSARPMSAGRRAHQLMMREGPATLAVNDRFAAQIKDDPDNHPVRLAVPGVILKTLAAPGRDGTHVVNAELDLTTSRLPLTPGAGSGAAIRFEMRPDQPPVLKSNATNIPIQLLYLSPGRITSVEPSPTGIGWRGEVTPTHRFLPKLQLRSSGQDLQILTELNDDALRRMSPLPGARITRGQLSIALMPEFRPEGSMEFELAPGGRRLMAARLSVYPDAGLAARGDVELFIPGVRSATGQILYRQQQWSMSARVQASNMDLPYLRDGELTANYERGRFSATGRLNLDLPGGGSGHVSLGYDQGRWLFAGQGAIVHPRFGRIDVGLRDDGETFTATGSATMELSRLGLTPRVGVTYRKARSAAEPTITGRGTVEIRRPKLSGNLTVDLHANGQFTARGEVQYPIRDDMIARLGVEIDAAQRVRTTGEARLTRPVRLFQRRGSSHSIRLFDMSVPIPGLSTGLVGMRFGVSGGVSAGYGIGPGELRDVVISGAINPFDPDADPVLDLTGTLAVTAGADLGFWVRGSLIADAGLAEARGSLTVAAGVEARGGATLTTRAHYERGQFGVTTTARASATLDLRLTLDAGITLTTVLGEYGPGAAWTWRLAEVLVPTGLGFAFEAPVAWSTAEGLKLPTPQQITWEPPKAVDAGDLMRRIFAAARVEQPARAGA